MTEHTEMLGRGLPNEVGDSQQLEKVQEILAKHIPDRVSLKQQNGLNENISTSKLSNKKPSQPLFQTPNFNEE